MYLTLDTSAGLQKPPQGDRMGCLSLLYSGSVTSCISWQGPREGGNRELGCGNGPHASDFTLGQPDFPPVLAGL